MGCSAGAGFGVGAGCGLGGGGCGVAGLGGGGGCSISVTTTFGLGGASCTEPCTKNTTSTNSSACNTTDPAAPMRRAKRLSSEVPSFSAMMLLKFKGVSDGIGSVARHGRRADYCGALDISDTL